MKKPLSILLALLMLFGIFSMPLSQSFAAEQYKLQVTTSVLNVRDAVWGSWMGSVYKDQEFTSTESKQDSSGDTWYAIDYHGKTGWIHGDFVSVSTAAASQATASSGNLTVATNYLNVRGSVWGDVVDTITFGEKYAYSSVAKDSSGDAWYKISKGWVHGDYVKVEASAPASSDPLGKFTVNSEALRVRASVWGEYLTTVYRGSTYNYYATQKDSSGSTWYQLEIDGSKGWVHGDYITVAAQPTQPAPAKPPAAESAQGEVKVNSPALNVRSAIWGSWIGTAAEGEIYEYLSTAKDSSGNVWYKIQFGSKAGWVHGDYVSVVSTQSVTPPGNPSRTVLGKLYVTSSVLNVRDAIWGNWIGETYNSTAHDYYANKKDSSGNTWYEIAFGTGSGWVHGDFVSLVGSSGIEAGDIIASSSAESKVYALADFTLQITLKDSAGKALTGQAGKLGARISGARDSSLVKVGGFSESSPGVYRATARISDAHQRVKFTFTLNGASLGESAIVNSGASEFQERWLKENVGVYMNLDGWYGYQCKDVLDSYANDMFGDYKTIVGFGSAAQLFDGPSEEYFIKIRREATGPNSIPKMGDVIIYGGSSRIPSGHLSVVISATAESIYVLEQNSNGSGSTPAMYDTRGYTALSGEVIGWLRPRVEKIKNAN